MEIYHIRRDAMGGAESCYAGIGDAAILYLVSHDLLEDKIPTPKDTTLCNESAFFDP